MTELPDQKFNIIYADPPWSYRDKALAGNRGAGCKYDVMDTRAIAELPIKNIAATDSVLFMWVTMPKLNECFEVIKAWGFEYKTCGFVWVKYNKNSQESLFGDEKWFMGMGNWTRANAELCLIATRGKPKRESAAVLSIVDTSIKRHSQKPLIVRDRIVQLCGDLPRIELFARSRGGGWHSWGNQLPEPV